MKIACIVGARPNFMKMAPILRAMKSDASLEPVLIHTGQHYDANLSDVFFDELGIAPPDFHLGIGSGSQGKQIADVLVAVEQLLDQARQEGQPIDRMVVVGDVNSTLAATLAAVKCGVPVAHVEAGLRSFDRTMPEEINRIMTDSVCDLLLVSEPSGMEHLEKEGHPQSNIHLVGNVMIDTLLTQVERAKARTTLADLDLESGSYGVVTLHRPSNVDSPEMLRKLLDALERVSEKLPLVFPIHPRTLSRLKEFGLEQQLESNPAIHALGPSSYLDFLCLTSQAKVIVTDSGGLQEESTALGIPCLTMRPNTERPVTVTEGTSSLLGDDVVALEACVDQVMNGEYKQGRCPELWDGHAAERIVDVLVKSFASDG